MTEIEKELTRMFVSKQGEINHFPIIYYNVPKFKKIFLTTKEKREQVFNECLKYAKEKGLTDKEAEMLVSWIYLTYGVYTKEEVEHVKNLTAYDVRK